MNRKSLMSSGLGNESTRNKLKELALYDSERETIIRFIIVGYVAEPWYPAKG